jgi:hypothetical protein
MSPTYTCVHYGDSCGTWLSDVSCPSVSLCVALDQAGNVIASSKPTGGAGAWKTVRKGADTLGFSGVSCASATFARPSTMRRTSLCRRIQRVARIAGF